MALPGGGLGMELSSRSGSRNPKAPEQRPHPAASSPLEPLGAGDAHGHHPLPSGQHQPGSGASISSGKQEQSGKSKPEVTQLLLIGLQLGQIKYSQAELSLFAQIKSKRVCLPGEGSYLPPRLSRDIRDGKADGPGWSQAITWKNCVQGRPEQSPLPRCAHRSGTQGPACREQPGIPPAALL